MVMHIARRSRCNFTVILLLAACGSIVPHEIHPRLQMIICRYALHSWPHSAFRSLWFARSLSSLFPDLHKRSVCDTPSVSAFPFSLHHQGIMVCDVALFFVQQSNSSLLWSGVWMFVPSTLKRILICLLYELCAEDTHNHISHNDIEGTHESSNSHD